MNAFWLALLSNVLLSHSVTVYRKHRDIAPKSKIELKPIYITCSLNDIIRISAPIINGQSLYYLNKPDGDVIPLNITSPTKFKPITNDYGSVQMLFKKRQKPFVTEEFNYDVFSLRQDEDVLQRKEAELNDNEFLLGPVMEEDHGNWVLSVYNMDYNGDWIEMFQVISIQILQFVHIHPWKPNLHVGATLHLRFAYPIKAETCQLVAPTTSFDRLFERSGLNMDRCHFILRNVTESDAGVWRIVAVGRIVYEGGTFVTVLPHVT